MFKFTPNNTYKYIMLHLSLSVKVVVRGGWPQRRVSGGLIAPKPSALNYLKKLLGCIVSIQY